MINPFAKRHLPLAVKNALIYLMLILLSSFLIGYSIYRLSAALIIASSKAKIKNDVQNVALKMTSQFDHVGRDIQFLSNNPIVKKFIQVSKGDTKEYRTTLLEEFKALLESRTSYFQIRLIGKAHDGKELIRVEREGTLTKIVADSNLQEKGDRNYFLETIKLQTGSVYFSEIDLNREFGKIETPYRPTLRVASPLYVADTLFGIVIINIDLRKLFDELKNSVDADEELFVFNNAGYFLIHPDEAENFGFEFGRPPNVYRWFSDLKKLDPDFMQVKSVDSLADKEKRVTVFYTLLHPRTGYKLFMALSTSERYLLFPFISWRKSTILLTISITFAFLGIAFLWMRRQSKELKKITNSMVLFSENYSESNLLTDHTDEIGDLAVAFSNMATTIRKNVNELESSKEIAIQANHSKEEFLENMSHEIRNPLQSILGMTNILEQNHPRDDQRAVIKTIQFSSQQLLSLVNDILDFSKIRIGLIQLQPQELNLAQLLSDIVKSHLFLAQSKNVLLQAEIPNELNEILIRVDSLRLSQILNNLIVNAIKFTPSGKGVLLKVILNLHQDHVILNMMVSDHGIGISPDEVEKIKNRYYSGNAVEINNNLNGAGLGLPIVVQLLKLFQADLQVQSEIQHGSTFSFLLTLPYSKSIGSSDHNEGISRILPKGIRTILCIDDDPQIIYYFKHIFNQENTLLTCIEDENSINKISPAHRFDLIISDYMMMSTPLQKYLPKLSSLKADPGLFILFSGMDPMHQMRSSIVPDVDAFLQKPMSTTALFETLNSLWDRKNYSIPQMQSFYKDYDYEITLVSNALKILIEEWNMMRHQFHTFIQTQDQESFEQVYHKIITSVRRFKLDSLQRTLNEIHQLFESQVVVDDSFMLKLDQQMLDIEFYFEKQLKQLPSLLLK